MSKNFDLFDWILENACKIRVDDRISFRIFIPLLIKVVLYYIWYVIIQDYESSLSGISIIMVIICWLPFNWYIFLFELKYINNGENKLNQRITTFKIFDQYQNLILLIQFSLLMFYLERYYIFHCVIWSVLVVNFIVFFTQIYYNKCRKRPNNEKAEKYVSKQKIEEQNQQFQQAPQQDPDSKQQNIDLDQINQPENEEQQQQQNSEKKISEEQEQSNNKVNFDEYGGQSFFWFFFICGAGVALYIVSVILQVSNNDSSKLDGPTLLLLALVLGQISILVIVIKDVFCNSEHYWRCSSSVCKNLLMIVYGVIAGVTSIYYAIIVGIIMIIYLFYACFACILCKQDCILSWCQYYIYGLYPCLAACVETGCIFCFLDLRAAL